MSDQWTAVVVSETGELYSLGSVVADPLPPQFDAVLLSNADADAILGGRGYWDAATRSVVMLPESEWPQTPG